MRQTIRKISDENSRLKEQLMRFITENEKQTANKNLRSADQESVNSGDQSDSLYQMLQEYMVENQKLKNENDLLKESTLSIFLISSSNILIPLSNRTKNFSSSIFRVSFIKDCALSNSG